MFEWKCQFCGKNKRACWQYDGALRGWVNDVCSRRQVKDTGVSRDYIDYEQIYKDFKVPVVRRCRSCGDLSEHCDCGGRQVRESHEERFRAGIDDEDWRI